jgi:hypothetical protein
MVAQGLAEAEQSPLFRPPPATYNTVELAAAGLAPTTAKVVTTSMEVTTAPTRFAAIVRVHQVRAIPRLPRSDITQPIPWTPASQYEEASFHLLLLFSACGSV